MRSNYTNFSDLFNHLLKLVFSPEALQRLKSETLIALQQASSFKLSHLSLIIFISIIGFLAVSWILWRFRVSRYNEFWGLSKSVHQWSSFGASAQPHYCSVCSQLICGFWIFRNTGWECRICARTTHMRCMSACDKFDCKCPSQPEPLQHQLVQGNLAIDSVCCVCGTICASPFGLHGLRCLWCGRTVHEQCLKRLSNLCDLGPYEDLLLPPGLVKLSITPSKISRSLKTFREFLDLKKGEARITVSDVTLASQRYMQQVRLQLKEGLSQVSAGLGQVPGLSQVRRWRTSYPADESPTQQPIMDDAPPVDHQLGGVDRRVDDPRHHLLSADCPKGLSVPREAVPSPVKASRKPARRVASEPDNLFSSRRGFCRSATSRCDIRRADSDRDSRYVFRRALTAGRPSDRIPLPTGLSWRSSHRPRHKRWKREGERCDDRLLELSKLMPAKADIWRIDIYADAKDSPRHRDSGSSDLGRHHLDRPVHLALKGKVLLTFVNVKSGGQVGTQLLKELYKLLNPMQVIDIQHDGGPARALHLFRSLAEARRLRVLVCGGDGTAAWVMREIRKVYESSADCHVPVGVLPLGTGNDLARVFGWGDSFDGNVERYMRLIQDAQPRVLDQWSLKVLSHGKEVLRTTFNNYMDVGVAAKIALKFHQLRESHPELLQSTLWNKFLYGEVGLREWVTGVTEKSFNFSKIRLWCDGLQVILAERQIEGLIVVNIPSFSGGVDLWGAQIFDAPSSIDFRHYAVGQSQRRRRRRRHLRLPPRMQPEDSSTGQSWGSSTHRQQKLPRPIFSRDGSRHLYRRSSMSDGSSDAGFDRRDSCCSRDYRLSCPPSPSRRRRQQALGKHPDVKGESGVVKQEGGSSVATSDGSRQPAPKISPSHSNAGGIYRRWRKQSMHDELLEVVAVRSLLHLGQLRVGLAEPIRVCQGRELRIEIPVETPFQIDGEPQILPAPSTIEINHIGQSFVLSPVRPREAGSILAVTQVLDAAVRDSILTPAQRNCLLWELEAQLR